MYFALHIIGKCVKWECDYVDERMDHLINWRVTHYAFIDLKSPHQPSAVINSNIEFSFAYRYQVNPNTHTVCIPNIEIKIWLKNKQNIPATFTNKIMRISHLLNLIIIIGILYIYWNMAYLYHLPTDKWIVTKEKKKIKNLNTRFSNIFISAAQKLFNVFLLHPISCALVLLCPFSLCVSGQLSNRHRSRIHSLVCGT